MSSYESDRYFSDNGGCMIVEYIVFFTLQDNVSKDTFTKKIEKYHYETPIFTWYDDISGCVLMTCYIEHGEGSIDDYIDDYKEIVESAGATVTDVQTKTY